MFVIVTIMSNFLFLKKKNENLFNIIAEAEKLFRDEYFEQAVIQTRRFAENLCKDLLRGKVVPDETFDSMINRLKDHSFENMRMSEFTEDLYFLKKHGNNSAHSSVATKDGKIALECLERAYEISILYFHAKYGYHKRLDKSVFSEEVLMTGKVSSSDSLKEKYSTELKKSREKTTKTKTPKTPITKDKKVSKCKTTSDAEMSIVNKILIGLIVLLLSIVGGYFLLSLLK